ncbi:hypothetical protein A2U01_0004705 [Trifolium medium]|uniref:Uncharacterized protein n=1 Tax=Trifolium medium TaxID=97028 RepID=A0A392MAP5_9FABA|nr:hypothetical protein [Trifolium medium]
MRQKGNINTWQLKLALRVPIRLNVSDTIVGLGLCRTNQVPPTSSSVLLISEPRILKSLQPMLTNSAPSHRRPSVTDGNIDSPT